jgi:L-2-hydroxycarboxylate dehydrogenase (NAD+)
VEKHFVYRANDLYEFIVKIFVHLNMPFDEAQIAARIILEADLRGIHSHGIIRVPTLYVPWLSHGYISNKASISTINETPVMLSLDGGNGMGHVIAYKAMQRCIEKAKHCGVAIVTVRNSNHLGIAGYYAMMALEHDMIGISLTNSTPYVAPTYARTKMIGTNPIAVAVPAGEEYPFVLDMATSVVTQGLLDILINHNEPIPLGWGIDGSGANTTDPRKVLDGGAINPLGASDLMRSYKGYGLGLLVDILCGVLAGANFSTGVTRPGPKAPAHLGHFFAAIKVDTIRPIENFKKDMDQLIHQMNSAPKVEGQERIYIAGEKEFELADRYNREGVPVYEEAVHLLEQTCKDIGNEFNLTPIPLIEND